MSANGNIRFLADANLGALSKWLRLLGYDAVYWRGESDRTFLEKARKEERIALTRKKDLVKRQFSGRLLLIKADTAKDQVREVLSSLALSPLPDRYFTICLKCNVSLEKIKREEVRNRVPVFIYEQHSSFQICPRCQSIYWPGSHKRRSLDFLKEIIPR